nr:hypothetical protein CR513_39626 [Ipomoea trifida]
MVLWFVFLLCHGCNRDHRFSVSISSILLVRIPDNHNRTNAMPNTVITDASKSAVVSFPKPLLHVVVLHDVDFERNLRVHQRLSQIGGLSDGESVEIVLQLLLRLLVVSVDDGEVNRSPVGAVEHRGGADVDENHGVARAEVLVHRPLDSEGGLIAEVHGDANPSLSSGGRRFGRRRSCRRRKSRRRRPDFDIGETWEVGIHGGVRLILLHFLENSRVGVRVFLNVD